VKPTRVPSAENDVGGVASRDFQPPRHALNKPRHFCPERAYIVQYTVQERQHNPRAPPAARFGFDYPLYAVDKVDELGFARPAEQTPTLNSHLNTVDVQKGFVMEPWLLLA
jgi:hypothetical protein